MLSRATWCFESIHVGLVCAVIGGGRDVVCDQMLQHDQLPRAINSHCNEGRDALGMY